MSSPENTLFRPKNVLLTVLVLLFTEGFDCTPFVGGRGAYTPLVSTARGDVRGSVEISRNGRRYLAFRSVPYAQPPVGLLRFASPKAVDAWTGVKDVSDDAPICTQYNVISLEEFDETSYFGQEDCLYLSVFTHQTDASRKSPVMVYLHGGGFESWTGARMHGPQYFMDHDIVAVFINYRLGPFGFLSTEDSTIAGNFGLKDQLMGLKWVRENIAKFGGDAESVTLFGESAGAAAVHVHMKSSQSLGLFNRAIMNSGSVHCPWALSKPGVARSRAVKSARLLNCPHEDSRALLTCLRSKSTADIIKLRQHFAEWDTDPFVVFPPVVERTGGFFTDEDLRRRTNQTLLTGLVSQEGAIKVAALLSRKFDYTKQLMDEFEKWAPMTFGYGQVGQHPEISRSVRQRYFRTMTSSLSDSVHQPYFLNNLTLAYSDSWFVSGAMRAISEHSGKLYRYELQRKPHISLMDIVVPKHPFKGLVSHGDTLMYFFNMTRTFPVNPLDSEDNIVSEILVTLWANFISQGNPGGVWTSSSASDCNVLKISPDGSFSMGRDDITADDTTRFWTKVDKDVHDKRNRVKKTRENHK